MSEAETMRLAVGDEVRVHFHPPGSWKSFSEGVIRRVDVTTPAGRFFVLEVRNEILLDQPHRVRRDFHDYVPYECRNDFPGRIEVLTIADQNAEKEPASAPILLVAPDAPAQEVDEQPLGELVLHSELEAEETPEAEIVSEPPQVDVELQPVRRQRGLFSALFGRRG
jgi:hypothetical protein